jgi:azurin
VLVLCGAGLLAACSRARSAPEPETGAPPVELHIASDGDFLAFTPDELTVRSGAHVRLFFHHAGHRIQQEHNFVLLEPGTADAFIDDALKAGADKGWIPPGDGRIIAATPLCDPGGTVMVDFVAPEPGDYPFVCSFEGHGFEMRGILHVTA